MKSSFAILRNFSFLEMESPSDGSKFSTTSTMLVALLQFDIRYCKTRPSDVKKLTLKPQCRFIAQMALFNDDKLGAAFRGVIALLDGQTVAKVVQLFPGL